MFANLSSRIQKFAEQPHEAYQELLIAGLVGTGVVIIVHFVLVLLGRKPTTRRIQWNLWEKFVYLVTVVSVAILAVTAFYAVIRFGAMHEWWLFAHMFGAGAFVGILPVLAITWGRANRFGAAPVGTGAPAPQFFWLPKFFFWILLISGFVVVLTMLLSMLPIFGTDGLLQLLDIHRYSGLLAVVALALHLYCVLLQRIGFR